MHQELPLLDERQSEILRAVIREHIATAEPVASATLVRRYGLSVSSATVRSELAGLEDVGLLTHPHTSAGRVPTDLGYRYFIEMLLPAPTLAAEEQVTVSHQFQQGLADTAEWLGLAASTLARLTTEASIVTPPVSERATLRHVEAVPINEHRALVVVVTDGGAVRQQLIELREPVTTDELRAVSRRLAELLAGQGAEGVARSVAAERGVAATVAATVARTLQEEDDAGATHVHLEGIGNILAKPEFEETTRAREMLGILEDRTRLSAIFPQALRQGEVLVTIGSEHPLGPLRTCSVVFGRYGGREGVTGYVGVVGPTRMDYARTIGAVRFVGALMSDLVRVVEGD
ncbi:MAG TPA: heat-inducible transcriptional repressor HrcA [Candidatus Limnocylindria bacterium]|nr:heat-inducible transcriptional repressor HrcA [Candidatus Limnocylindria bacterium]